MTNVYLGVITVMLLVLCLQTLLDQIDGIKMISELRAIIKNISHLLDQTNCQHKKMFVNGDSANVYCETCNFHASLKDIKLKTISKLNKKASK